MKNRVNLPQAMAGEGGAERVAKYSVPMAAGLNYNYAAKNTDLRTGKSYARCLSHSFYHIVEKSEHSGGYFFNGSAYLAQYLVSFGSDLKLCHFCYSFAWFINYLG